MGMTEDWAETICLETHDGLVNQAIKISYKILVMEQAYSPSNGLKIFVSSLCLSTIAPSVTPFLVQSFGCLPLSATAICGR
jgi:hypothetical protein